MKKQFIYFPEKRLLALLMTVILLVTVLSQAFAATSVGSSPDYLSPSTVKTFVMLSKSVVFFTGDTYATGSQVMVPSGAVCQLVSTDFYVPSDGKYYYSVYYDSQRYNALMTDLQGDIMSDSALQNYITGTLWQQSVYTSLKKDMNLTGDVRVYALQLALQKLGYYTDKLDGNYGNNTVAAVKKFQKANGLTVDGSAGVLTQPVLYSKALSAFGLSGSSSSTTTTTTTTTTTAATSSGTESTTVSNTGTLKTTASVNLRKSASKTSARLAIVPKGVSLTYTATSLKSGIIWYKVTYNTLSGWLMGTYVSVSGSSSSSSSTTVAIGTIVITKAGTRVRTTANGKKSGTLLSKGTIVSQLSEAVSAGGYNWYQIKTGSGLVGYVRSDCAQVYNSGYSASDSSGTLTSDTMFIKLPTAVTLFTTQTKPSSGGVTAAAGSIVRLYSKETYTVNNVVYCSVYYNNVKYNCVYNEISSGIMSASALSDYVTSLWSTTLPQSLKKSIGYYGDIRVYALQVALTNLGLFTGTLDGTFGNDTETAVRNFQRQNELTIDGMCGNTTWKAICAKMNGSSSSSESSVVVNDFGTVKKVLKASWNYDDNGASLFAKGSYATVMDVETGKVFKIYRWSGGNHADCVPATTADTETMCDIVGYPYNSSAPTSAQLAKIKADGSASTVTYTWPDFKNSFGGSKNIGSAWDRRPCLLNVNGTVYAVSIYGFPHGFTGTDSFSNSKFPSGTYFYKTNNYYGMMCVHFVGSKTHGGTTVDAKHQQAIEEAYAYAKKLWPSLCE